MFNILHFSVLWQITETVRPSVIRCFCLVMGHPSPSQNFKNFQILIRKCQLIYNFHVLHVLSISPSFFNYLHWVQHQIRPTSDWQDKQYFTYLKCFLIKVIYLNIVNRFQMVYKKQTRWAPMINCEYFVVRIVNRRNY